MSNDIRAALERLVELSEQRAIASAWTDAIAAARAALAEPVGEQHVIQPYKFTESGDGPTDEELLAMRSWSSHSHTFDSDLVDFTRAVLARWGRPTAQPLHPAAARAAIREVAAWLDERGMHGCSLWLREEADRCP